MIATLNKISISAIYVTGETERELSYTNVDETNEYLDKRRGCDAAI